MIRLQLASFRSNLRISMLLMACAMLAGSGWAIPQSGTDDPYDATGAGRAAPTKALVCNSNGYYCTGTYDELIEWIRFWGSGYGDIIPTAEVRDLINATGTCDLKGGARIEIPQDLPGAETMVHHMTVALALGKTFRLQWIGDETTNICELRYIIFYP